MKHESHAYVFTRRYNGIVSRWDKKAYPLDSCFAIKIVFSSLNISKYDNYVEWIYPNESIITYTTDTVSKVCFKYSLASNLDKEWQLLRIKICYKINKFSEFSLSMYINPFSSLRLLYKQRKFKTITEIYFSLHIKWVPLVKQDLPIYIIHV